MKIIIGIVILAAVVIGFMTARNLIGKDKTDKERRITDELKIKSQDEPVVPVKVGLRLPDEDGNLTVPLGEAIQYSDKVHGSVGIGYRVEYDKEDFKMDSTSEFDNPGSIARRECGGDSAVKTCILTPLRKGTFTVRIIHEFRGEVEKVVTFRIKVK